MRRHVPATLGFALLLGAGDLSGQTAVDTPQAWTRHTIQSATLGMERGYLVALPQSYGTSQDRYPVLVLLDANDEPQFAAAIANSRFLANRNEIPELIIVGILNGADRTHDLTPPTRDSSEQRLFPTAGGGVAFAKYLTSEVLPAVHAGYRTLPAVFLAGHSFGGMFALQTATSLPDAFRGAIVMSPALQWSNTEYVTTYADALAKRTGSYRLFVTSGGLEPPIDVNTQRMIARLDSSKASGRVAIGYRRYPDHTHAMTPLPSFVDGLRYIFEPVSLRGVEGTLAGLPMDADSAAIVEVVRAGETRYVDGARALGLPARVPEDFYNGQGYGALQWFNNPAAAVTLFRRNVELYPGSANVYDSLGDGLLARGDRAGARSQFARAVEIAEKTGHPVLSESRRKLEALKE
jgi:predicted alpha/beta superfamily hydrolase